ncbi:MAG: type II secretion system F family protein [Cyanobacteriota bacterium]
MPIYTYKAIETKSNKQVQGQIEAPNEKAAREALRKQGTIPTTLEDMNPKSNDDVMYLLRQTPFIGRLLEPRVRLKDVVIFTQQLATLIDAGIPLVEALFMLEQQTINIKLKDTLNKVRTDVLTGDSLSRSLARHPEIFSKLYINLIRAGEVSGELEKICHRLNMLLEAIQRLNSKLVAALTYPIIVVVAIVGVVTVLVVFVVPVFKGMYDGAGQELPLPTIFVLAVSDFVISYWWLIILVSGAIFLWFNWFRKGVGKPLVDEYALRIPLIGPVVRAVYVSRFVRTLGTVFGAGVSITESLATAAGTVDNYVLQNSFAKASESLRAGGSLSKPLEKSGAFPLMVVRMIAVGEETGNLETMLEKSANFLDIEVDNAVEAMTTMIEPILTVVMGGVVLVIALALYLPLFDMHKVIH